MDLTKLLRVMKLTAFLLLAVCMHAGAAGNAQGITLKVKDMPLEKVFSEIKKQTGYVVFYEYITIKDSKPVTLEVRGATVEQFLKECFRDQPLDFAIEGKTILVRKKNTVTIPPPTIDVKGKIVNENGEPVFATILIKGTQRGVTTNQAGEFKLITVEENAILVIAGVNIETREINVNGKTDLGLITVKLKIAGLGEVMVNKGYYSEKQKLSTANVGRVTSREIEQQPVVSPLQAMQGRIPGVTIVQQSGVPGGPFVVRIRGTNSIASGNNPLYIVDGVPFNGDMNGVMATINFFTLVPSTLSYINPQDIESIEVLKDADATAIYGSRGANGVILITTKKAKPGKTAMNINVSRGVGQVGHFVKYLNKEQYIQMRMQAFRNAGTAPGTLDYDVNGAWNNNPETDWPHKLLGGNAQYTDAQLSFSGGNANTQFSVNGGWHRETTVFPIESPFQRRSIQFSVVNSSPDKKLSVQLSANYSSTISDMPYTSVMDIVSSYPDAPAVYDDNGKLNWQNDWSNPYNRFETRNKVNTNNLFGSAVISYKVWNNITAKFSASYNQLQFNDNQAVPTTYFRPSLNNTTGNSTFSFNNSNTWNLEPQLNYETHIGKGSFAALAGTTFQGNKGDYSSVQGTGYSDNNLLSSLAAAAALQKGYYKKMEYRYRGIYVRLNYNWQDKYVVNATARTDGSSRFAPSYRFREFGSVGAAWVFSNEEFFQKLLPFVSFGKLRGSYGIIGNDQFDDYRYLDLYNYTSWSVLYQATQGLFPGNLYNPDLTWEKNKKLEIGMELGLWKDRLVLTASWFRNRTGNQIVEFPLPATTGFPSVMSNLPAVVQNTGWEYTLASTNIDGKYFKWKTTFNITDQQNKLISFPGLENTSYNDRLVIGQSVNNRKVLDYAGVDPMTGLYTFHTAAGNVSPAVNTSVDRYINVNRDFPLSGGIGNTFSYKRIELDVFFQFSKKNARNPMFYQTNAQPGYFSRITYQNVTTDALRAWQKPGDITDVEKLSPQISAEYNAYYNVQMSTYNYVDASYVKLKNVMLSWQLSPEMRNKLHLQNARVYVQAQNLFTITPYKGWDPEPTQDQLTLPPLRTITAGIQLTL